MTLEQLFCMLAKPFVDLLDMCNILLLCTLPGKTHFLPVLTDWDVKSGYCTRLLEELVVKPQVKSSHVQYVILNMRVDSVLQHFNTSNIDPCILLRMSAKDPVLLERMLAMGMRVDDTNVSEVVGLLKDEDEAILDLLLAQGVHGEVDQHILDETCRVARVAGKHRLASCLKEHGAIPDDPKVCAALLQCVCL